MNKYIVIKEDKLMQNLYKLDQKLQKYNKIMINRSLNNLIVEIKFYIYLVKQITLLLIIKVYKIFKMIYMKKYYLIKKLT